MNECPPGLLGNKGIYNIVYDCLKKKKAAAEAKQYLLRKLASIEHML